MQTPFHWQDRPLFVYRSSTSSASLLPSISEASLERERPQSPRLLIRTFWLPRVCVRQGSAASLDSYRRDNNHPRASLSESMELPNRVPQKDLAPHIPHPSKEGPGRLFLFAISRGDRSVPCARAHELRSLGSPGPFAEMASTVACKGKAEHGIDHTID